jgi:hypothetical protein
MSVDGGPPAPERRGNGRRTWWILASVAAALALVVVILAVALRSGDDGASAPDDATTTSGPASTVPPTGAATTTVPPATTAAAPTTSTPPTTNAPPSTAPAGRTSPLDLYATCGTSCPGVQYSADGLPIAYHAGSKTMTVLETTPRELTLDVPETLGRIMAVGPDGVAYLLVESADAPYPGRILAVPTGGPQAGTVHEVVGPTDGLGSVVVLTTAEGIDVVDCCGVGVPDSHAQYVDAAGAALPGDPTRADWSWEWPLNSATIVHHDVTGEAFEVPQQIPEREGPRRGDLRPLLDGRVPMVVDDGAGALTVWVLAPDAGTWTSTALGNVLIEAIDPAGAVLTRDPSTLAYDLVALA